MRWTWGRIATVSTSVAVLAAILITVAVVAAMAIRSIGASAGLRIIELASVLLVLAGAGARVLRRRASLDRAQHEISPPTV